MNTPREILSQLQDLSRTCETPEDGVLKALKIIGDSQNEIWQAAANQAVHHKLHGKDQTAAGFYAAILGKRDAAQPNGRDQRPGEQRHTTMKTEQPKDSLIEAIQAAVNNLKVPESCEGKMRGEYVKAGMRLAVEAVNASIEKHQRAAAVSNEKGQR